MSSENTVEIEKLIIPPDYHVLMASIVYLKTTFIWDRKDITQNEKMLDTVNEMNDSFVEKLDFYKWAATTTTDFVSYSVFPAPDPQTSIQNTTWINKGGTVPDEERTKAMKSFFVLCDSFFPHNQTKYEIERHKFLRLEILNFLTSDRLNQVVEQVAKTKDIPETEIWKKAALISMCFCKKVEKEYTEETQAHSTI